MQTNINQVMLKLNMQKSKLFVQILFGIVLAILITSFLNIGLSLIYEQPKYESYCQEIRPLKIGEEFAQEQQQEQKRCSDDYQKALQSRNQNIFFILAPIGFILLIIGTLVSDTTLQVMLMGSGFLSTLISIFQNIQDKLSVFITIGLLLIIGILYTIKKLK